MANSYNRNTGRSDAEQSAVMKVLRRPVLVDNAVHHAEYTKVVAGHKVVPPTRTDFESSHDRRYKLVEEEDGVRLLHNSSYDQSIFYYDRKMNAGEQVPVFLYAENDPTNRLIPHTVEATSTGSRFTLQNLKGRSLNDIGFTERKVRLGQRADVGLRTSDLAMRIIDSGGGSVNSATIDKKRHTTNFISYNFNNVDAISAVRFVNKHDGHSIRSDQFGNIRYNNQNSINREHHLPNTSILGGVESDNITHAPNRVTVYGKKRGNNDDNVIRVDDLGAQTDGVINEASGGVHVPTASTEGAARRIGQSVLATAKRAKGTKQFKQVMQGINIRPGDQIHYDALSESERGVVLSVEHNISEGTSDIRVASVPNTLEDTLQRFQEDGIVKSADAGQSSEQIQTQIAATGASFDIKSTWIMASRTVRPSGFIIGHSGRGRINGIAESPKDITAQSVQMQLSKKIPTIIGRG